VWGGRRGGWGREGGADGEGRVSADGVRGAGGSAAEGERRDAGGWLDGRGAGAGSGEASATESIVFVGRCGFGFCSGSNRGGASATTSITGSTSITAEQLGQRAFLPTEESGTLSFVAHCVH